jgi:hypothetical protein
MLIVRSGDVIKALHRLDVRRMGNGSVLDSSTINRRGLLERITGLIASTWATSIIGSCPSGLMRYKGIAQ